MTFEEAQAKHTELKSLHSAMRLLLLEMRDRKGWKALGFSSWEEYGEQEWGFTRQHLNRLATSAYIQNLVEPIGSEEIPESQLRPLTSVPDDAKIEIWQQVKSEYEKITGKVVQDAVDDWKAKNEMTTTNKLLAVHELTNSIEQTEFKNVDAVEKEVTLAEFGTYVLGCSNAIAIAQKKESDAQYELKKIKDQAGKIQEVSVDKIAQIFMGILVDVLD
jgi:hypothetical protein